jgi:hypothetical protein
MVRDVSLKSLSFLSPLWLDLVYGARISISISISISLIILNHVSWALFASLKSQAEKYCSLIYCERENTVGLADKTSEQGCISTCELSTPAMRCHM